MTHDTTYLLNRVLDAAQAGQLASEDDCLVLAAAAHHLNHGPLGQLATLNVAASNLLLACAKDGLDLFVGVGGWDLGGGGKVAGRGGCQVWVRQWEIGVEIRSMYRWGLGATLFETMYRHK